MLKTAPRFVRWLAAYNCQIRVIVSVSFFDSYAQICRESATSGTSQLRANQCDEFKCNRRMIRPCTGHRYDDAVHVFAFGLSLYLTPDVFVRRDVAMFGKCNH